MISNWPIGIIRHITPITKGTSSKTFKVEAARGCYVLRGLSSQQQAEREYDISKALQGTNTGAEIIPTRDGKAYVQDNGLFYNLQVYLPGNAPDFTDEAQIRAAAETAAKMHRALSRSAYSYSAEDRFSTISLLENADMKAVPKAVFPADVTHIRDQRAFVAGLERRLAPTQTIHGDLGAWNLLWCEQWMRVIDFGESRMGNIHFDLAAVLCSILAGCRDRETFRHRKELFLNSYEQFAGGIDEAILHVAVYLWLLRGVLAASAIPGQAQKEKACCHFANELMRYFGVF